MASEVAELEAAGAGSGAGAAGRVRVQRHSLLFRVVHWLIVLEGLVLGLTGVSLSSSLNLELISYDAARSLHLVAGFSFIATAIFFLYYFVASGEYRWYGLRRIPRAFDYLFAEVKAWFLNRRIEEPIRYDPARGYEEKVVPTEVLAWWGWFVLGVAIVVSGLALVWPEQLVLVNRFWASLFADDFGGRLTSATRMAHFLAAALILVVLIIHAYAGYVFGMLRSIVFGDREEPVVG